MKYFFTFFALAFSTTFHAQLNESFSDGNFTNNPTWQGDDSIFTIVATAGNMQLRSNKTQANSSFYLATPNTQSSNCQWEFFTRLAFNTSSTNFVDVYLTASAANLINPSTNGYFVRIGGTTDEVSLYKRSAGTVTKLIDGTDGMTNASSSSLKIKVICTTSNAWTLSVDVNGTGTSFTTLGTVTDNSITGSAFFGVAVTQSTASFFQKHYFDTIYVGPIIYDVTPPVLVSAAAVDATHIDVVFDEALSPVSPALFSLAPTSNIVSAAVDAADVKTVHLTLQSVLTNGITYSLSATGVSDLLGNVSGNQYATFSYLIAETPQKGDVILTEFMCDPSPTVGLPEVEFVEIYNNSNKYFDLNGWKLGDQSADGIVQHAWLAPHQYAILCATSHVDTFAITAVGVTSFPSLNNAGDALVLRDNANKVLDSINYTLAWYKDTSKENGGFTVERIQLNDPCSAEDNWKASTALQGGTPGTQNAVFDASPDTQAPFIQSAVASSPNYLTLSFSEGMDSLSLVNAVILVSPQLAIQENHVFGLGQQTTVLQFATPLVGSQPYTIELQSVADCWGNTATASASFILPELPAKGDVVINEILFNPLTGGSDWVEVYNTSAKAIDLVGFQLANYEDSIANVQTVSQHFLLKGGSYAVLGKDSLFVKQHYPAAVGGTFVYCPTPSYNNDSGSVYLLFNGELMDAVSYSSAWQFSLLVSTDGVSLERIDPKGNANTSSNWHSAAETIGFATPGAKNSQYVAVVSNGEFSYTSKTVSPDNDGFEDILLVNYSLNEEGLIGKFSVYDDRGRLVNVLFSNELLATSGTFSWNGLTKGGTKASIGTYVGVFEVFSLSGSTVFTQTKAFVVAGKL